ncbi:protein O-mannosyl-transferase family [Bacteroidota bacterium]
MRINDFKINIDLLFSVTIFTISLIVYIITLCPTVYLGDTSEFVLNSITLGVNHAPGYPLYNILGRVFNLILFPFPDAVTINLLSAFLSSVSSVILYHILLLLTKNRIISFSISLIFAFSYTFWSRVTIAEVYSLTWLFIVLSIYFSLKWYNIRECKYLYLLSFIAGLGLSQHTMSVIFSFSIILFILITDIKILRELKSIILIVTFFLLGISVYIYLPLRAQSAPPLNIGNPENWENIKEYFNIAGGYIAYSVKSEEKSSRLQWLIDQYFTKEFWYFGIITIIGLFTFIRKNWRLTLILLSIIFLNVYWALRTNVYLMGDLDAYFMPSYLACIILLGIGIAGIYDIVSIRKKIIKTLISGIILLMPVIVLISNFKFNDKSNNTIGYDLGKNLVNNLDKNAVFIGDWDECIFLLNYFNHKDTALNIEILPSAYLATPWFIQYKKEYFPDPAILDIEQQFNDLLTRIVGKRPVFIQFNLLGFIKPEQYEINHKGVVVELLPKNSVIDSSEHYHYFNPELHNIELDYTARANLEYYNRSLVEYIVYHHFDQKVQNKKPDSSDNIESEFKYDDQAQVIAPGNKKDNTGKILTGIKYLRESPGIKFRKDIYLINKIEGNIRYERGEYNKAVSLFNKCISYNPNDWETYAKRGNALLGLDKKDETIRDWEKSLQLNPRNNNLRQKLLSLIESSLSR